MVRRPPRMTNEPFSRLPVAAVAAVLALLAPSVALGDASCHAPECLVQLGSGPALPPGPLMLSAQRTPTRLSVQLSQPALLTLRGGGQELDRWLAPAGRSVHPLATARAGALRLIAVDGAGDAATRRLPPPG